MSTPDNLATAGADVEQLPAGYKQTASGLVVPDTVAGFEREDWPQAKVDLLRRAGAFTKSRSVSLALACEDDRCKHDPVLRRVDVAGDDRAFVLACHHKIRVCVDRRQMRKDRQRRLVEARELRRRQRKQPRSEGSRV